MLRPPKALFYLGNYRVKRHFTPLILRKVSQNVLPAMNTVPVQQCALKRKIPRFYDCTHEKTMRNTHRITHSFTFGFTKTSF